jgi:hypothetical protein
VRAILDQAPELGLADCGRTPVPPDPRKLGPGPCTGAMARGCCS